mmetsp:Transcript_54704/g.152623  ORF Transcript_54704/g.152623 Transcript_54704/m.152623 type:complete len:213 (+) Transcript_54704:1433-2071(+)
MTILHLRGAQRTMRCLLTHSPGAVGYRCSTLLRLFLHRGHSYCCLDPDFLEPVCGSLVTGGSFGDDGAKSFICFGHLSLRLESALLGCDATPRKQRDVANPAFIDADRTCDDGDPQSGCDVVSQLDCLHERGDALLRLNELAAQFLRLLTDARKGPAATQTGRCQRTIPRREVQALELAFPNEGVEQLSENTRRATTASQRSLRPEVAPVRR